MPYLEIGGKRHSITGEDVAIGMGPAGEVGIGGDELSPKVAILAGQPDGQVIIRKADSDIAVLINSVALGQEPTPLLHGDKLEVEGRELLFVDDRRSGSTHFVQAVDPEALKSMMKPGGKKGKATSGTGGRLVSLTDGREYSIERGSLLIGREAGCDVVIESKKVSRRHAEIVATPKGYLLIDSSTNGTLVNGERVAGQRLLARADVIRCGDDDFRFYADVLSEPEAPPAEDSKVGASVAPDEAPLPHVPLEPAAAAPGIPAAPSPETAGSELVGEPQAAGRHEPPAQRPPAGPPAGSSSRLRNTMFSMPPSPSKAAAPKEPSVPVAEDRAEPAKVPRPPVRPPPGAEYRLSDTLGDVPRRPPQPAGSIEGEKVPLPPPGAEHSLADTLHGVRPEDETVKAADEPERPSPGLAPPGADSRLGDTIHGIPGAAPKDTAAKAMFPRTGEEEAVGPAGSAPGGPPAVGRPSSAAPLASLVVRSGPLKGRRLPIRYPVVNIGRAEYNDVVLPDESVSTVHAKLQRREGIWVLVDQESTNGTVVDGERLTGETVLAPGAIVRFGTLQTIFEPTDDLADIHKGKATKVIESVKLPPPPGA
ncbi:MAG: FHA domain-containing protein [Gemmatimonadales bacterium]